MVIRRNAALAASECASDRKVGASEEGQAITEYIIMVALVISFYLTAVTFLTKFGLAQKLVSPLQNDFARAYQYGKSDVKGFENGGPSDHARALTPGNNRMFISPTTPQ